jgi:cytochrome bd ubiquinol oxidase subunit II
MDYLAVLKISVVALIGICFFNAIIGVFGLSTSIVSLIVFILVVVPFQLSLWEAASATLSQVFLLVGAAVVTPVVLGYSAFAYRVFRGRTPEQGWES